MKSKADGWLNTGSGVVLTDRLPYQDATDGDDKDGPPPPENGKHYYMPLWEIAAEVKREYGGINSSGGPQVSGRSDQSDFEIEWDANAASPILYEHCCSGKQLAWVHVVTVRWAAGQPAEFIHIRMQDVNVTSYEFTGQRWLKDDFATADGKALNAASGLIAYNNNGTYDLGHSDSFTLLYTSIAFKHFSNTERGWNTGEDDAWTP
jgi:type VI protein secretion system component Hcp